MDMIDNNHNGRCSKLDGKSTIEFMSLIIIVP